MQTSVAKKIFAVGVAASTVLMSLAPFAAHAAAHANGTNFKSSDGTVWMVIDGQRRPYNSAGAFLSYGFNSWSQVVDASAEDLALPVGANIPPQDGKIFCATVTKDSDVKGECSLVTGGQKAAFTAAPVFTGLGFSFSRANYGDSSFMSKTTNIDNTTAQHRAGVLVNNAGTVYLVGATGLLGIPDVSTFNSWGYSFSDVVPANTADKALSQTGVMATRTAGQLSPSALTGGSTVSGGNLTVAAGSQPTGATLASGSAFNPVLNFSLSASQQVNVTGITFTKTGLAANTNISGIDLVDQTGKRYGNVASSISTDNKVTILFSADPIVVTPSSAKNMTLRINLASSVGAGTTVQFALVSASAVTASGSVGGTYPVSGNTFTLASGGSSLAGVTTELVTIYGSQQTLNVDEKSSQELTKFRIAETTSNEGVNLYGITLYNYGNAAATDYKDVQLVDPTGTVVATAQPNGQNVVFTLGTPFFIDKGLSKDFTVKATIVNGTTRTIQLAIYNDYDVMVKGNQTGVYVLPTTTTGGASANTSSFPVGNTTAINKVLIGSGSTSFNKDTTSSSSAVAPGAQTVELAKFYAKPTGENMELRKITLAVATSSTHLLTGSITVKVNGASVHSISPTSVSTVFGSPTAITLSTYPVLTAGVNNYITVESSVSSAATGSDSYKVYMDLTEVKRLVSNDLVDPAVSQASGNVIQVSAAALTAKTLTTPVAASVVAGTNGVELARFELNASTSGEDVKVSQIVVADGAGSNYTNIANLAMYNASDMVNSLQTSSNTNTNAATVTFTFSSPILVTRTAPVVLVLKGDAVAGTSGTHTFNMSALTATGHPSGNTVGVTPTGSGQGMTLVSGGTVTLSLVSGGTNGSPSTAQVVQVGANDGVYYAFKLTPQYEAQKITTLKLTATGTALTSTAVKNLRLYRDGATTPFASASEMTCGSNVCTYTWTASDNLLTDVINPGAAATIYVKADIGAAGSAVLGNDFRFMIASSTADVQTKGISGTVASVTGTPSVTVMTHIVPFNVAVTGETPSSGSSNTQTIGAGTTIARFKVSNSGTAPITLTNVKFTNNGSHTGTGTRYTLYASGEGTSDYTNTSMQVTASDTTDFGAVGTPVTVNGGSFPLLDCPDQHGRYYCSG